MLDVKDQRVYPSKDPTMSTTQRDKTRVKKRAKTCGMYSNTRYHQQSREAILPYQPLGIPIIPSLDAKQPLCCPKSIPQS
jgi:hypothetical protein